MPHRCSSARPLALVNDVFARLLCHPSATPPSTDPMASKTDVGGAVEPSTAAVVVVTPEEVHDTLHMLLHHGEGAASCLLLERSVTCHCVTASLCYCVTVFYVACHVWCRVMTVSCPLTPNAALALSICLHHNTPCPPTPSNTRTPHTPITIRPSADED